MPFFFYVEQFLNGVQLGMLLFLLAAGLTLVFGIMDLVNLAHGSLYMMGAFFCAQFMQWTGSFLLAVVLAIPATLVLGIVVEVVALRTLYARDHLDQVLATFGLILFFNELVLLIWPLNGLTMPVPNYMMGTINLPFDVTYPIYRFFIIGAGLLVAAFLYVVVQRTRLGMLIRAGASNRRMVSALGVNIRLLFTLVFGLGAVLAGFAGMMIAPLRSAQAGMGEEVLISAFVVIVIGGIGSIRGAFVSALLIGVIDTMGRTSLKPLFLLFLSGNAADAAAPAISSMLIYILMAAVLFFRPTGLFPAAGR